MRVFSDKADVRAACSQSATSRDSRELCRSRVPVVESTDSRKRDDSTAIDRFHVATIGRTALQGLMRTVLVMIVHVRSKHSSEMLFTQHDHVVETLAPD